jgi:hypothetical protein
VRGRWLGIGCLVWLLCFLATEEVLPLFKLWSGSAARRFQNYRMGYEAYMNPPPAAGSVVEVPLRIVSWNVARGQFGAEKAVGILEAAAPDILFFQEYTWGAVTEMTNPLKDSRLFGDYFFACENVGAKKPILCRYPVRWIGPDDPVGIWKYAVYEVRPHAGLRLYLVNVHLATRSVRTQLRTGISPEALRRDVADARDDVETLRTVIAGLAEKGPVILAGDFNLPANYAAFGRFEGLLKDAWRANGFGWGKTAPTLWRGRPVPPVTRIDAIWVPAETDIFRSVTLRTPYSDHAAVLAEIAVPAEIRFAPGATMDSRLLR